MSGKPQNPVFKKSVCMLFKAVDYSVSYSIVIHKMNGTPMYLLQHLHETSVSVNGLKAYFKTKTV